MADQLADEPADRGLDGGRLVLRHRPGAVARTAVGLVGLVLAGVGIGFLRLEGSLGAPSPAPPALMALPPLLFVAFGALLGLRAVTGPSTTWTVDRDGIAVDERTIVGRLRHRFVDADRARAAYLLRTTQADGPASVRVVVPLDERRRVAWPCPGGLREAERTLEQLRAALGPPPA